MPRDGFSRIMLFDNFLNRIIIACMGQNNVFARTVSRPR